MTSDGNDITIEPLASGGNPKYGGDDVTQAIIDFVLNEFGQRIRTVNPNLRFDIPYLKSRKILQPSGNPEIDNATRINTPLLYRNAEEMKRILTEKTEAEGLVCSFTGYYRKCLTPSWKSHTRGYER